VIGKNRENHVERMAQEVDDRRLWEDEADEAEMGLIQRHLVGEPAGALADRGELAGALEIIVAQIVEPFDLVA
jgi:hypothetical protein